MPFECLPSHPVFSHFRWALLRPGHRWPPLSLPHPVGSALPQPPCLRGGHTVAQAGSLGGSLTPLSHGPCGAAADSVVSAFKLYPGPGYFVTLRLPPPYPDPPSSPPEPGQGPCPGSAGSHLYHPFPQPFPAQQPK